MIHFDQIRDDIAIVRWYDGDGQEGFDKHLPYKAVATLIYCGVKAVEICGLHGKMTRAMRDALKDGLAERGFEVAYAYRHGRFVAWDLIGRIDAQETVL